MFLLYFKFNWIENYIFAFWMYRNAWLQTELASDKIIIARKLYTCLRQVFNVKCLQLFAFRNFWGIYMIAFFEIEIATLEQNNGIAVIELRRSYRIASSRNEFQEVSFSAIRCVDMNAFKCCFYANNSTVLAVKTLWCSLEKNLLRFGIENWYFYFLKALCTVSTEQPFSTSWRWSWALVLFICIPDISNLLCTNSNQSQSHIRK